MNKPSIADEKTTNVVEGSATNVAESSADPYIGNVIGQKYEVQELIGRGGMGRVYKVRHQLLDKPMALKLLTQTGKGLDDIDVARFDAEAKAASGLHHQNLAGIHDYGTTDDGSPYLVMDFIDGESLSDLLERDSALKEEDAIELFLQICSGLEFAHSKHLIHRDIKPSNIMVSKESGKLQARIVDFGIAKKLPTADEHNPTLTGTGQIVGSPQYMSPEQCLGYKLDVRSDIYSLGLVMFETLTGKKVFEGENAIQVIYRHVNERAPLFKSVAPNTKLSSSIERIVLQALEKEADNRYQTVEDLKRDLELIKQGKNPVKEVSRMRNNIHSAKKFAKLLGAASLCGAVTLGVVWIAALTVFPAPTPWGSIAAQGQEDLKHFNYSLAENKYRRALDVAATAKAPAGDREQMIFDLAMIYNETNRPEKAVTLLQEGLDISNTHAINSMRGFLYDEMAIAYLHMENYKRAEATARAAVEIKEATRGKIDGLAAHSLLHLSQALCGQKRYAESEAVARKLVVMQTKLHPNEDDPDLYVAYNQLTDVLADEGAELKNPAKTADAIVSGKETLRLMIKIAGADSPETQKYARWFVDFLKYWHKDTDATEVAKQAGIASN